jgi:hypothetical protein
MTHYRLPWQVYAKIPVLDARIGLAVNYTSSASTMAMNNRIMQTTQILCRLHINTWSVGRCETGHTNFTTDLMWEIAVEELHNLPVHPLHQMPSWCSA